MWVWMTLNQALELNSKLYVDLGVPLAWNIIFPSTTHFVEKENCKAARMSYQNVDLHKLPHGLSHLLICYFGDYLTMADVIEFDTSRFLFLLKQFVFRDN